MASPLGRRPSGAPPQWRAASEGQRDAALPGDVVLRLVESVAVELVDVVSPLRADPEASEAILEPGAEIAGELGPRAVRLELVDTDRPDAAEHGGRERPRPGPERL